MVVEFHPGCRVGDRSSASLTPACPGRHACSDSARGPRQHSAAGPRTSCSRPGLLVLYCRQPSPSLWRGQGWLARQVFQEIAARPEPGASGDSPVAQPVEPLGGHRWGPVLPAVVRRYRPLCKLRLLAHHLSSLVSSLYGGGCRRV